MSWQRIPEEPWPTGQISMYYLPRSFGVQIGSPQISLNEFDLLFRASLCRASELSIDACDDASVH